MTVRGGFDTAKIEDLMKGDGTKSPMGLVFLHSSTISTDVRLHNSNHNNNKQKKFTYSSNALLPLLLMRHMLPQQQRVRCVI